MRLEDDIHSLSDQLSQITELSKKNTTRREIEKLKGTLNAVEKEWQEAHSETDAYRELFGDACEFCARFCSIALNDVFNAALGGFYPGQLMSELGLSEDRLSEIVSRLSDFPREKWTTKPWANCVKPKMRSARRVSPENRSSFVARNLKSNLTMSESSNQGDASQVPTGHVPYLGLVFHDDFRVSRLGDKFMVDEKYAIQLSRQQFAILKFIHGAGEDGRTDREMTAAGFTSVKQEKSKINKRLTLIDLRFEKRKHKLIHDRYAK